MRISYDPEANAASIYLVEHIAFGEEVENFVCGPTIPNTSIILGFDNQRKLISIEILGARELLPQQVLEQAE
jgi:uncharacterized protein YuzE